MEGPSPVTEQQNLGFLQEIGEPVKGLSIKLMMERAKQICDRSTMGKGVAYLVIGNAGKVTFDRDKENRLVRVESINAEYLVSVDHAEAILTMSDILRKKAEAEGVYEIPFPEGDNDAKE